MIIDCHCHVYPKLSSFMPKPLDFIPLRATEDKLQELKPFYRKYASPYLKLLHRGQVESRKLPENYLASADRCLTLLSTANMLIDNNIEDLFEHIKLNNIDYTVLIAHPPYIPNEFVLQLSRQYPNFIPFVKIPYDSEIAAEKLEHYIKMGAKGLKIHAASDGGEVMNEQYLELLAVADQHKLPVIIHTGCLHLQPLYKDPQMGHAENFQTWFQDFPNIRFILAHMNYHFPDMAFDIIKNFDNVYTDTSWQPTETIAKAVNILGDDKIFFGTDWPLVGNNINICLERIYQARDEKLITKESADKIIGLNARHFFGL